MTSRSPAARFRPAPATPAPVRRTGWPPRTLIPAALAALVLAGLGSLLLPGSGGAQPASVQQASLVPIGPKDPIVAATERARRHAGARVRSVSLTAAPTTIRIGKRRLKTWAFNGTVPGPEIRVNAGDVIRATVRNRLPAPLTIHWHGITIRNDMDGVPGVTQKTIPAGGRFVYEFTAAEPGTYFYHPHTGVQLDRGLYGALIVDNTAAKSSYARDIPLLLDDWIDGTGTTPDKVLMKLQAGMQMGGGGMSGMPGMPGMGRRSANSPLGTDTGDVDYPFYLINGRTPADPRVYTVKPGQRVRLRLINAGADTPFRVAVGGQAMTVIATDGYPVKPVKTDALLIGMGERYDVVVAAPRTGAIALVARPEGETGQALAVLRGGPGRLPPADLRPAQLRGHLLTLGELNATPAVALPAGKPDRTYQVRLTGSMMSYKWAAKAPKQGSVTLPVRLGQRVRLVFENTTGMWHPMHLHGHTFQVITNGGSPGPRKDTVIVPPKSRVTVEFIADNPGKWALHCHNVYHAESGMLTFLTYVE